MCRVVHIFDYIHTSVHRSFPHVCTYIVCIPLHIHSGVWCVCVYRSEIPLYGSGNAFLPTTQPLSTIQNFITREWLPSLWEADGDTENTWEGLSWAHACSRHACIHRSNMCEVCVGMHVCVNMCVLQCAAKNPSLRSKTSTFSSLNSLKEKTPEKSGGL